MKSYQLPHARQAVKIIRWRQDNRTATIARETVQGYLHILEGDEITPTRPGCRDRSSSRSSGGPGTSGCTAFRTRRETTGPATIRDSLDHLGAVRIGHGISAAQDAALLAELAERGVALEVCLWSNVRTRAVPSIEVHPLPRLLDAGVRVTLDTDDPGMFGTDLNREYVTVHRVFGLDRPALAELAPQGVMASFAPEATRSWLLAEIDAYTAR